MSRERSADEKRDELRPLVLEVVRDLLIEIMELEEGELEIGLNTHFQDELELESIEMIALGDALREHYQAARGGDVIDFTQWLTQLSIDQLMELRVHNLVDWIVDELSQEL